MLKTLVNRQRSIVGSGGGFLIAGGLALITYNLAADPGIPTNAAILASMIGGTLVAAFAVLGYRLGVWRGGIYLDEENQKLGLGFTQSADVWWHPVKSLSGVQIKCSNIVREEGPSRSWSVEMALSPGVAISLLETFDEESAVEARDALLTAGLWEASPRVGDVTQPVYADRSIRFGVHRNGALQLPLFLFGLSLTTIGTVFFLNMEHFFVFGLFFAPVLALIGAILLVLTLFKRFGREELIHQTGYWQHCVTLGPIRWGERKVRSASPHWRIRVHPFRGASLELVGDDGILLMGSGATTCSRLTIGELAKLPEQFASVHQPESVPSPLPEV